MKKLKVDQPIQSAKSAEVSYIFEITETERRLLEQVLINTPVQGSIESLSVVLSQMSLLISKLQALPLGNMPSVKENPKGS
jgi:hypothetical protein